MNYFIYASRQYEPWYVYPQCFTMQARAAKRLFNKEKGEEEKARKEDNVQQTKELLRISDENMVWTFLKIIDACTL